MLLAIRNIFGPFLLMLLCPPFALLMWYTNTHLEGSFLNLIHLVNKEGLLSVLMDRIMPFCFGSPTAWKIIACFSIIQLLFLKYLPGPLFQGPLTPKGNLPYYKDNGFLAFVMTMSLFLIASVGLKLFPTSILYDELGSLLGALNLLSLTFCGFLYVKGRFFPSSSDAGTTRNPLFDYYWGTELYPMAYGWNIKQFITCRFGMMIWGVLLLSYCAKQIELTGELSNALALSVGLQFIYLAKFFLWEKGYLRSLDIMHDRAGFYICWGCLVWVPCIYTSPSMYLVIHPIHLNTVLCAGLLIMGTACILMNYLADLQRLQVRATEGKCRVWGKAPLILPAHYTTEMGEKKETILLASGFWGIARHFHYIPEIAAAFLWSVPALFTHFSPYFYVCFLSVLLLDRAYRDDKRCALKYKEYWTDYCRLVPYKIIPFVL